MIIDIVILISMVVSAQSLSCMHHGPFSLNNMLHAAEMVTTVTIHRDITPKPNLPQEQLQVNDSIGNDTHPIDIIIESIEAPQIAGWSEPRYYTATVKTVLSGNTDKGNIIVQGGIPCRVGPLTEKTTYLLFGSIHQQKVEGTHSVQFGDAT
jgi:hypothetical protein